MATIREVLKSTLSDDAALSGYLPGGWLDRDVLPADGGGAVNVPRDSSDVVQAFGIIRWRSTLAYGPQQIGGERQFIELYLYDETGNPTIDLAVSRIKTLLHDQYHSASDRALAHTLFVQHMDDLPPDDAIGGLAVQFSRYQVIHMRT
ncbi:MAG: hypothetical protein K8L99_13445 [Anaerolineae bacterium]|nr:hypothetical protein [Anaerolineae bacterium]